jgi:hypothetical protein
MPEMSGRGRTPGIVQVASMAEKLPTPGKSAVWMLSPQRSLRFWAANAEKELDMRIMRRKRKGLAAACSDSIAVE